MPQQVHRTVSEAGADHRQYRIEASRSDAVQQVGDLGQPKRFGVGARRVATVERRDSRREDLRFERGAIRCVDEWVRDRR